MTPSFLKRITTLIYNNKWLLSRRIVQGSIILAFVIDFPKIGYIAKGNLSSSFWFDIVPLTDPFILLQSYLAGSSLQTTAVYGAIIIALFYSLFGGRIYCSWVCPINLITDLAYWTRQKLHIKGNLSLSRDCRFVLLFVSLALSFFTGTLAWEAINPITLFQRELLWTSTIGLTFLSALFFFDLIISRRGWCGHLCPVGAFYSLLGRYGRVRVRAVNLEASGAALKECITVCPEPHVLAPIVSQKSLIVNHGDCTRCGACIDKCHSKALSMKVDF